MFCQENRDDLKWACKCALIENLDRNDSSYEYNLNYIKKEATYEQLVNACFNEEWLTNYQESESLEPIVQKFLYEMCIDKNLAKLVTLNEEEDPYKKFRDEDEKKRGIIRKTAGVGAGLAAGAVTGAAIGKVGKVAGKFVGAKKAAGAIKYSDAGQALRGKKGAIRSKFRNTKARALRTLRKTGTGRTVTKVPDAIKSIPGRTGLKTAGQAVSKSALGRVSRAATYPIRAPIKAAAGTKAGKVGMATAAAYMLYRIMRRRGESQAKSAMNASKAARSQGDAAGAQKWAARAQQANAEGK